MKAPVRWACTWVQLAVWAVAIGAARAINKPPAPQTSPLSAAPGPILRAGGRFTRTRRITTDIDETCGCAITHDSKLPGIVMEPCGQHEFVLDDWERRLPA